MGNSVLAVVRDSPDFVGVLANQRAVFPGRARAVGGGEAGSRSTEPPRLGHRAEFDRPVPASAGVGHGGNFGCDRDRARTFEQWAAAAGGGGGGGGLFCGRHHGGGWGGGWFVFVFGVGEV